MFRFHSGNNKNILIKLAAILAVLVLIYCGFNLYWDNGKSKISEVQPHKKIETSKTIVMTTSGSTQEMEIRKDTGEIFMKIHPDIKIKWVDIGPERLEKLLTLIAAGEAPDIMYINENTLPLAQRGVLLALDDFVNKDVDFTLEDFYDGPINVLKLDGVLYALPQEISPFVIYYNKDLFDKAGVPYPTDDWTQDEFYEIARKLTDRSKGIYGYRHPSSWPDQYFGWLKRNGVKFYSDDLKRCGFDGPETLETLRLLRRLVVIDKISPNPLEAQTMGRNFEAMFRNGQAAMDSAGMWLLPVYKAEPLNFKWDIVKMPKNLNQITMAGVLNWAIYKDTKHPDEAWEVLKFFVGPEGMKKVAQGSMALPSRKDNEANKIILESKFPNNAKTFIDSVPDIDLERERSSKLSEISAIMNEEIDLMLIDEQSPEDTQKNIVEKVNKILAKQ